ncbi:MAG: hypothetical protein ACE5HN_09075 [Nitrospiria bacterium]
MRADWLWVGIALLTLGGNVSAEEGRGALSQDIEFLEFLGRWETADGEWIDPIMLGVDPAEGMEGKSTKGQGSGDGLRGPVNPEDEDDVFLEEGVNPKGKKGEDE